MAPPMYAVISTGGKQYRVEPGQRLQVELLGSEASGTVDLDPVLLVDGDTVLSTPAQLGGAKVSAKVLEEAKGPKIRGFTYKPKSNNRRRWGHRQRYSVIEITTIAPGRASKRTAKASDASDTNETEAST